MQDVKALLFDYFGTVVDWRSTVIEEGEAISRKLGISVDWPKFADSWRLDGYIATIMKVASGQMPWAPIDIVHRRKLDPLLQEYQVNGLSEEQIHSFNQVWHRLKPWADSVEGLTRLKKEFIVAPFSNGDFNLLVNSVKLSGLPWDCILSGDMFKKFKPNPEIYKDAVALLGMKPEETMMVACHPIDLESAKKTGMKTAFVSRPLEFGPQGPQKSMTSPVDLNVRDFLELATKLGA
jgi:2-haloacid dehalogenase